MRLEAAYIVNSGTYISTENFMLKIDYNSIRELQVWIKKLYFSIYLTVQ